jgi:signal transduction histidine kinase
MTILIGVVEAILILVVVVILTMSVTRRYYRSRLKDISDAHKKELTEAQVACDSRIEELQAKHKRELLEQANQAQEDKSEILTTFDHQVDKLFLKIMNDLDGIKESIPNESGANASQLRRLLDLSTTSVRLHRWRTVQLIDNLDMLSKVEEPVHLGKVKLDAIVDDLMDPEFIFHDRARSKGIELVWWAIPEGFPFITGNADSLRQLFINLIDNAIKYTGKENGLEQPGAIEDRDRIDVSLEAIESRNVVIVQVADTGRGIPEEDWSLIFEKDYTVEGARGRPAREGGKGLGLYIVKQVVTKHKGTIEVTSEPGKGTIFTITLPIQRT